MVTWQSFVFLCFSPKTMFLTYKFGPNVFLTYTNVFWTYKCVFDLQMPNNIMF